MVRPRDKTVTAKACRMAKWVKAPAIKLENLSYIPEICMKERTGSHKLSSDIPTCTCEQ